MALTTLWYICPLVAFQISGVRKELDVQPEMELLRARLGSAQEEARASNQEAAAARRDYLTERSTRIALQNHLRALDEGPVG